MDPNIHCVDTSWALLDDTYKVLETMICHSCSNTAELTDHFLKLHVSSKNEAIWMLSEVVTYSDLYNWYWEQSLQPWKNVKACKIAVRIYPTSYNAMSWHYFVKNALLSHALHLKKEGSISDLLILKFSVKVFSPIFLRLGEKIDLGFIIRNSQVSHVQTSKKSEWFWKLIACLEFTYEMTKLPWLFPFA